MINQILKFHTQLEKGQAVKIITARYDYESYLTRSDVLKKENENTLIILKANGGKVAINTDYIVSICVIRRF